MTVDPMFVSPTSITPPMSAMAACRPFVIPEFTTRRRSSIAMSSARVSDSAFQSWAAKHAVRRACTWLAAFSIRRASGLSSSNLAMALSRSASSNTSTRLTRSPIDGKHGDPPPLSVEALQRSLVCRIGDDCSAAVQLMHCLDMNVDALVELQPCVLVCGQVVGPERCLPPVVDIHTVRGRLRYLVPVERGVAAATIDQTCAWAAASPARNRASSSSKAASMSSTSNTTWATTRSSPSTSTTPSSLAVERLGPLVSARIAKTTESEAVSAGRDNGRRYVCAPKSASRPHASNHRVSTVPDSGVHDSATIFVDHVRRPSSFPTRPSRVRRSTS